MDKQMISYIDRIFSRRELDLGILATLKSFFAVQKHVDLVKAKKIPISQVSIYKKKGLTKIKLIELYLSFFNSKDLFNAFRDWASADLIKVMDTLLWKDRMTDDEIQKELGISISVKSKVRYQSDILKSEYYLLGVLESREWHSGGAISYNLYIPLEIRRILVDHIPEKPKNYYLHSVSKLKETTYLFKGEEFIIKELPALINYYRQDHIKLSKAGTPLVTSLRKAQKKLKIKEFFPDKPKEFAYLRTHLLMSLLTREKGKNLELDPLIGLQKLMLLYLKKFNTVWYILPHLKGTNSVGEDAQYAIETNLFDLLKEMLPNTWFSMDNLFGYTNCRLKFIMPIPRKNAIYDLYYKAETGERIYIKEEFYDQAVLRPTLEGTMFLFASLGLVDLAYDDIDFKFPTTDYWSFYDGLKYIRLTNLGAYLSGQTKKYEAPDIEGVEPYRLSKDALIITVDQKDEFAENILSNYTVPMGRTRYRTDPIIFLKNCVKQKDVEDKITLFKQVLPDEFPPIWIAFFEELIKKCNPLKKVPAPILFKLPQDPIFARLIASDKVLKPLIIKGENFHVVVLKKNLPKFKQRLLELGYLL